MRARTAGDHDARSRLAPFWRGAPTSHASRGGPHGSRSPGHSLNRHDRPRYAVAWTDLDADLRGRCRPRRPASRPRPRHHRWRPRSARPRPGRTARACAAAEAWPSHYADRNTSRRAVVRWAARPACSLGGPQDRRPGTPGGPVPGTGFQLSAEHSVSPKRPTRAHGMCCNAASVWASDLDHRQRAAERRGSRPGSLPRHLLMARRMTVMHGRNQPGAVSPTRTERRECARSRQPSHVTQRDAGIVAWTF